MPLITSKPSPHEAARETVYVPVDRHTLAKRRWRRRAEDGTDLAVDLEQPCRHGELVLVRDQRAYRVRQGPEQLIRIPLPDEREDAARLGWFLGNQHLPVEVVAGHLQVAFDKRLHERLSALGVRPEVVEAVFNPDPHSAVPHHHH